MDKSVENFVAKMASALNNKSVKEMTYCSMKPVVFVTDNNKKICQTEAEIDQVNQLLLDAFDQRGVVKHLPTIVQCVPLSDAVFFVTVDWQFLKADDSTSMRTTCSYTLQKESDRLNMIVVVIEDYNGIVHNLLNGIQENEC